MLFLLQKPSKYVILIIYIEQTTYSQLKGVLTSMKIFFNKMLCIIVSLTFILSAIPVFESKAAVSTITGGYDSQSTAYNWGSYELAKTAQITLSSGQNDMWVKFTLPKQNRIYLGCSYSDEYEGMYVELYNSTSTTASIKKNSPDDIYNADTNKPFLALNCDNLTSSTQTYYAHVSRGTCTYTGNMIFTYSLNTRIKSGNGTFSFSGTAINSGNSALSLSGMDSSVLSLNLTNNVTIPPNAITTSVSTTSSLSPSQANIHHMILPSSASSSWYTATAAYPTDGSYNISVTDNYTARQIWQFKYNALGSAKTTMKNVSMLLKWEYDVADTNYTAYSY